MGGTNPAVLGLLFLLSSAVLSGFSQEISTNQGPDLRTEIPADATVSSIVNSTVVQDSSSTVLEITDLSVGGKDNETTVVTDPPTSKSPSEITGSQPGTKTYDITEAPHEPNSSNAEAIPNQAYTETETRGVTGQSQTQPPPMTHIPTTSVTVDVTTGTPTVLTTESHLLPFTPSAQKENNTAIVTGSFQPPATTTTTPTVLHSEWTSAATTKLLITTEMTTAQPTSPVIDSAETPRTGRSEVERDPSVLEMGGHKEIPGFHSGGSSNPLFVMIVSVFTIMVVMVVVAVGFHRYKKRNRRTDFRRLQDLPMDDMMEDTPLALYSY